MRKTLLWAPYLVFPCGVISGKWLYFSYPWFYHLWNGLTVSASPRRREGEMAWSWERFSVLCKIWFSNLNMSQIWISSLHCLPCPPDSVSDKWGGELLFWQHCFCLFVLFSIPKYLFQIWTVSSVPFFIFPLLAHYSPSHPTRLKEAEGRRRGLGPWQEVWG